MNAANAPERIRVNKRRDDARDESKKTYQSFREARPFKKSQPHLIASRLQVGMTRRLPRKQLFPRVESGNGDHGRDSLSLRSSEMA